MVARTIFDTVLEGHAIFDMVHSGHAAHRCACDKDAMRCKAAGNDMESEKGEGWFFKATEHRLLGGVLFGSVLRDDQHGDSCFVDASFFLGNVLAIAHTNGHTSSLIFVPWRCPASFSCAQSRVFAFCMTAFFGSQRLRTKRSR